MLLMVVFELCIVFSMLHVCAIPGVNMGCAGKLEHTSFNVNWLVSLFWLILLFMIAAGVIDADYAPNFLLNFECIKDEGHMVSQQTSQQQQERQREQARRLEYQQKHQGPNQGESLDASYLGRKDFTNGSFEERGYRGYRGANAL
jgi:hypothetical protein